MLKISLFFSPLLIIFSNEALAELKVDKAISQSRAESIVKPMDRSVIEPYAKKNTFDFGGDKPNSAESGYRSSFAWLKNGRRYYSKIISFVTDNDMMEECKDYPTLGHSATWEGPSCRSINKAHLKCHLFMLTEQGQIAGVGRINLERDKNLIKGKPFCFDVKAMAAPKEIPDTMLVSVGYIDSNWFPDPRNDPQQFPMTVLLRFKEEANGKLSITQDDTCLPNPNRIKTIAQARKELAKSSCK